MPPALTSRPRLIVGAIALISTAVVAVVPLLDTGPLDRLVQSLAGLALAAALVGVVGGFPSWGAVTAGVLGAQLIATLHDRAPTLDGRTPLHAAGLLLVAELVTWAAELRTAGTVVPGAPIPRPVIVLATTVAAYVSVLLLAGVVALPVGRDLAVTAIGAAGVALVTVVVIGLARTRARA